MAELDLDALELAAREALWTGRWYDGGCDTLMSVRDGEHEEVAHPVPLGLVPFLAAAQPAAVLDLIRRLRAAEAECLEKARLLGIGSERELALMAKIEAAERERDALRSENAALVDDMNLLRDNNTALRAKIEAMERQEPVAWIRERDGHRRRKLSFEKPAKSSPDKLHWSPLYALPGAKGEEK